MILGSKSNERKEESEVSGELDSEKENLMIVPQQESSSQEDFISKSMQEEFGKDLSFPIPATSKWAFLTQIKDLMDYNKSQNRFYEEQTVWKPRAMRGSTI